MRVYFEQHRSVRKVVSRQQQSLSPFISDHIDALFHALTGGWCQMTFSQIKAASTVRQQLGRCWLLL